MLNSLFTREGVFGLEQQQSTRYPFLVEWRAFYRTPPGVSSISAAPYDSVTAATPAEAYRLAQSRLVAIKLGAMNSFCNPA